MKKKKEDDIEKVNPVEQSEEDAKELSSFQKTLRLSGMYENWFLDYASYVILERAVPDLFDGLKPVQRRLMHSMKDLDDGRFNKVANIIGHTMKYHPHGDASIGDALVQLGQKDLLVETQGNWGNILTGDSAAAPRYIEARLSKFALEVAFNPKTTAWKASYDGRNKEPVTLPMKFPLLLAQGVEGVAVGLATKILPHNFNELIDASINLLKGKETDLYPDFPTGGLIDVTKYNDGLRGGKIRIRARISQLDKKTLVITEIPYETTTEKLIDSIITANEKGKIKIRKIEDNTAQNVEIIIHLLPGTSPDTTMDALYAFTQCEMSISPNCCTIENDKPRFLTVKEMLDVSTDNTVGLLKSELEIRHAELQEHHMFALLEKIFIEKHIYNKIEQCETWEDVIKTIDKGLQPYKKDFYRKITTEDIERLTEIKIKRISKFDSKKADGLIKNILKEIDQTKHHLAHLVTYAIAYFTRIKEKYGKEKDRKTEIRNFENIEAAKVAAANQKLFVNRSEGFIGVGLKKDEFVCECSDIDDIIVFREDGTFVVVKVADKTFVGQDIIHIAIFKKNDERTIYNMIYQDGIKGNVMVKRFAVTGVNREKEYDMTKGSKNSRILYFTANPNGEAEKITLTLRPKPKLKKLVFDFDFSELAIKGRSSQGNILSRHGVRKIVMKDEGVSTLGALDIWFDDSVKRLNVDKRGQHLGAFSEYDRILEITQSGHYRLLNYDLSNHFEDDLIFIEKFNPKRIVSAVYYDAEAETTYLKRFHLEPTDKKVSFIGEHPESKLIVASLDYLPVLEIKFKKGKSKIVSSEKIRLADFIGVKGFKAKGKRLSAFEVESIKLLDPLPYDEPVSEPISEETAIEEKPMVDVKTKNKKIAEPVIEELIVEPIVPKKKTKISAKEAEKAAAQKSGKSGKAKDNKKYPKVEKKGKTRNNKDDKKQMTLDF